MTVPNGLDKAYENFFLKSEYGQYFMQFISDQIDSEHRKAENNLTNAAGHAATAKAYRDIDTHIKSVTGGSSVE